MSVAEALPGLEATHRHDARTGSRNAARKARTTSQPPWWSWKGSRAGLTMKFIETYCVIPKGRGAGRPMVLAPYQREAVEQLFADGVRTGEYSMGRGGGKSTFMAALGLSDLYLERWQPQVPIIATKVQQAKKACYDVAVRMVKLNPELEDRTIVYTAFGGQMLATEFNGGEMFPFASDVDGLQGLDPTLALVDEMGFISPESWEALKLAGGKRERSLVAGLGTTGKKTSALYALELLAREGVILPGHVRINYSGAAGCSIHDRAEWHRANPALDAGLLPIEVLENDVAASPEDAFRAFRLNQWVDLVGTESWLGSNAARVWGNLTDAYEFDPQRISFAGVDVSLRHDTTALVRVQQRPDGRWHAVATIWRAPDGLTVDRAPIRAAIAAIPNLAGCAYDPRFFEDSAQELAEMGVQMIEVPQTPQRMVPAIGTFYRLITGGGLTHDGDPEFAGQVTSAVRRDSEHGFTLSKLRSELKIDAAIATALALSITDIEPPPTDDAFRIY